MVLFIKVDEIDTVFNAHHIVRISPRGDHETLVLLSVGKPDTMSFRVPYTKFVELLDAAKGNIVLKTIPRAAPVAPSLSGESDTAMSEAPAS